MNNSIRYFIFLFALSIWSTLCFNLPDYADMLQNISENGFTLLQYGIAMALVPLFLWAFLAAEPWVLSVVLPLYAIVGGALTYYTYSYKIIFTSQVYDAFWHTDTAEASGVITLSLVLYVLLQVVINIGFIMWRWKIGRHKELYFYMLLIILLPIFCQRLYGSLKHHYPLCVYDSLHDFAKIQRMRQQSYEMLPFVSNDIGSDSIHIIVILGEAVRADHLSLNGYHRATTPRLQQRHNLISLGDVYSPFTYTLGSIPFMLTPADSAHTEWMYRYESFIPYLRQNAFYTSWITNQADNGETFAHFMFSSDTTIFISPQKNKKKTDDLLFIPFQRELQRHGRSLIILHTMGSHWYYPTYTPNDFHPFEPTISHRDIHQNTEEQIINSYDNTICFMDWIVDSIISLCEYSPSIVLYQSDHGESLGEHGQWLHASNAEVAKYPAGFIWYSDAFAARYPQTVHVIDSLSHCILCTDYLFPFVMQTAGLKITDEQGRPTIPSIR